MKKNIIKKSALYSVLLGLLACNGLMTMNNQNNQNNRNLASRNRDLHEFMDKEDHRKGANSISQWLSFMLGLLTPQKPNAYYLVNLITSLQTLKTAWKIGELNTVLNKDNKFLSSIMNHAKPLALNAGLYGVGCIGRNVISQKLYPDNKTLQWGLEGASFGSLLIGYLLLTKFFNDSCYDSYKKTADDILESREISDFKQFETMLNQGIFNSRKISDYFGKALKKNNKKLINVIIECYYKKNPENIFSLSPFFDAIEHKNEEVFNESLEIAEHVYLQDTTKYAKKLVKTFLDVVTCTIKLMIIDVHCFYNFNEEDIQTIYTFLEKFFEVIQRMGCNPYTLASGWVNNPLQDLLKNYEKVELQDINLILAKANPFLEKAIHYFVEMGTSVHTSKMTTMRAIHGGNRRPIKIIPLDWAEHNPKIQEYFKLIGRYNKQLLNVNDGITTIDDLETFITKLKPEEQDAIFKVAATRGHMKTVTILGKIDDKYKLNQATKLATQRRLTPIVLKYCNSLVDDKEAIESIEKTLSEKDKKFFIDCKKQCVDKKKMRLTALQAIFSSTNDDTLEQILPIMQQTLNNAHPTKFNALVNEFRNKE